MTIIGVTNEPSSKIKNFIEDKGIEYVVAIRGAPEYQTRSIPHAWLVSAKGEIVWKGNPYQLDESLLEENLEAVSLAPTFSLPKGLEKAEFDLNQGRFGAGIKKLNRHLKRPKTPETEKAARSALEKIRSYGKVQLEEARAASEAGDYVKACTVLSSLERSFKGTKTGKDAKSTLRSWKKDKATRAEVDAAMMLQKAELLVDAKHYRQAAGLLMKICKSKKYANTSGRTQAEKRLRSVKKKL